MDTGSFSFDAAKAKATIEKGRRANWWRREGRSPRAFKYIDRNGKPVVDPTELERIRNLVIPPAWKHVRVNPFCGGKVQAIGMDSTGRVQYRYHADFSAKQQRKKYAKIERFGEALPGLRRITNEHIALEGIPKEKVLAVAMRLINCLYFRVGTDLSAKVYKTFGLTTLQKRHLTIGKRGELKFSFVGKSHVQHRKVLVDAELAMIMKDLLAIRGGGRLFRYIDELGKPRPLSPTHINSYLKAATGPEFSAKDFRTWGGSVLAATQLAELGPAQTSTELKKNIVRVVRKVAEELGNTPSVCRNSYIHPGVIDAYSSGVTIDEFRLNKRRPISRTAAELDPEERALLRMLSAWNSK